MRTRAGAEAAAAAPAQRGERVALVALSVVLAALVLLTDRGVLTPDTKPETFLAPWRTALATLTPWQDGPFLGAPNFNVGLAPVAAVLGLVDALGVPPWLTGRLWRLALLLVAAAGARRLVDRVGVVGPAGRVGAAVLYGANPYLLLGGASTPTLLPYAVLPWLVLVLRSALREPRRLDLPCAAALLVTATSGINAGVVAVLHLLAVVPVVVEARIRHRVRPRDVVRVLLVSGLLSLVSAAYWLVPALSAIAVGSAIAGTTETLDVIAGTSSPGEVVRGLGLWTLYGADSSGPFSPGLVAYLRSVPVVVASFTGVVLAAVGATVVRTRARLLPVALVAVAVPVMVGAHAGAGGPAPWGRFLEWSFENVPGAVAFRTTNKAGALLMLGLALLGAYALDHGWRRLADGDRVALRAPLAALTAVALLVGVLPAWTGGLWGTRLDVPAYWQAAATDLDASDPVTAPAGSRVLFAPGTTLARYRWGYEGPDELGNALLERRTVYRSAVPAGTAYAAGLLAGTDQALQDGTLDPGGLSALARYLGAGDVLVRNDTVWETSAGASPERVRTATAADAGLRLVAQYGTPGQNTVPLDGTGALADAALPPLQRFAVGDAASPVRQVAAVDSLLVDGDGAALPRLARTGLTEGTPAVLLAATMSDDDVRRALRLGTRVLLTDTNARRTLNPQVLSGGGGPLLPPGAPAVPTLALGGPDDQTVLAPDGDVRVSAEGRGLLFGPFPYGAAALTVDGDATTSWLTGNFGSGAGESVVLAADAVRAVPRVRLTLPPGGGPRATAARVTVSGGPEVTTREVSLPVPPARTLDVDLGAARGSRVRVTLTAVTDQGTGPVGLAEVAVPGWAAGTTARLPVRLPTLLADAARTGGTVAGLLARTPVDVLLARRRGPVGAGEDEEAALRRDVTLPVARTYTVTGLLRAAPSAGDALLDTWAPRPTTAAATASSRAARTPQGRASSAVDVTTGRLRDLSSAWVPDDPVSGQWVELSAGGGPVDRVAVTQPDDATGYATRARVTVDGRVVTEATLGPGTSTVRIDVRRASRVRVTLLSRAGDEPVRITDVALLTGGRDVEDPVPADELRPVPKTGDEPPCLEVARVDGTALRLRPAAPLARLAEGEAVPVAGCDADPVPLSAGVHEVRPVSGVVLDRLELRDTVRPAGAVAGGTIPGSRVLEVGDTARRVRTAATGKPYWVLSGTGFDPRWHATADGVDLGPARVLDGWTAGWIVEDGAAHDVRIRYGPARRAAVAASVSAVAVVGCLTVLLTTTARRRRRPSAGGG